MNLPNLQMVETIYSDPDFLKAFKNGWLCGFTWASHWNHLPGGPASFDARGATARNCWLAGWHLGKSQQNRTWTLEERSAVDGVDVDL